jgi:hypothetical protein
MIAAIHQPNYLPWPGYFFKLFIADVFVFLDDVKINKSGYTRRTKLRRNDGLNAFSWLTVPLRSFSNSSLINELEIMNGRWKEKHFRHCKMLYSNAPFGKELLCFLYELYSEAQKIKLLKDLNILAIKKIADFLGIQVQYLKSSELNIKRSKDIPYTLEICECIGAKSYVRGTGEKIYTAEYSWPVNSIKLATSNIHSKLKTHEGGNDLFVAGYSIIDFLAYTSKNELMQLYHDYALHISRELEHK